MIMAGLPRPLHLGLTCPHCLQPASFVFEPRHRPISEREFCMMCRRVHQHIHYTGKCPHCHKIALYDMKV